MSVSFPGREGRVGRGARLARVGLAVDDEIQGRYRGDIGEI